MDMKIGIDARFIGPAGTGLGTYTQNLIENLQKIGTINHYIIFLNTSNWDLLKLENKNFAKVLADVPWYSASEQIKMPPIFKSQNLDLLHVPHFNVPILYGGKFIVTIHDLIHLHFPQTASTTRNSLIFKIKHVAYKRVLNHAINSSEKIITPSNFVKEDILKNFKVPASKITATYEAAEKEYRNRQQSTVNRQRFLLYVGNAYPHKNLNLLLDALKLLTLNSQLSTLKLILVCPRDIFADRLQNEIKKRKLDAKVQITGYMPADDLAKLFRSAACYISPSLSEGFGLPGLNAMVSGIPLVCSIIPTFKEIYSDAAVYFNPNEPSDIARRIKEVLTDEKLRSSLIKKGKEQAQKYSWLKMVQQTLKVYEQST